MNPFVQAKLNYDPLKDFVAIGLANLAPHCLAVNDDVPAKTIAELHRAVEDDARRASAPRAWARPRT